MGSCLWTCFCLVKYDWLFWACFGLLLPIYFQRTLFLLPSLLWAFLHLRKPPFDRFIGLFAIAARVGISFLAIAAVHAAASHEHDLILGPIFMALVFFSVAWSMWARFDTSNVSYVVLVGALVHTIQMGMMCLEVGPRWVVWGIPTLFYFAISSVFWIICAVHLSRLKTDSHIV